MKIRVVIFVSLFLSSCSVIDILAHRDTYEFEHYWQHVSSKKKADIGLRNQCWEKAEQKYQFASDGYYNSFGKCMYDQGYRFYTTSWVYCYRYNLKCEIYNKYR